MNRSGNIDLVACVYNFVNQPFDNDDLFLPFLLGICGNYSANLPTNLGEDYENAEIVYEGKDLITSASTDVYGETKKLVFEYENYYE